MIHNVTMMDPRAYTIGAYMRVTSIAIALYDYLETYPTAWQFYREQWQSRRVSLTGVLFFLLRFISISTLALSNIGFFYSKFTIVTCDRFFLLPPAFKVMQGMISQAILGIRTYNLSRRSRRVSWFLVGVFFIACILQWVTTVYHRTAGLGGQTLGNCRALSLVKHLGAWVFYALAIVYDVIMTAMSIWYLLKYKMTTTNSLVSKVTKMMLYDGLGYLVVLTAVNLLNLILYKTSIDIQNAAASLGYCVSWIMSQRLLIHLYKVSRSGHQMETTDAILSATPNKSIDAFDLTRPDFDVESSPRTFNTANRLALAQARNGQPQPSSESKIKT